MQISPYLKDYGINKAEIPSLALGAHRVGQRLLPMNIREINEEDALAIFGEAYGS
jgi:alcohol dehydrogenase class IV